MHKTTIEKTDIESPLRKDIYLYTLRNVHGISISISNYGGIITSIKTPDIHGQFEDVLLGYSSFIEYLDNPHYFGATIGRYANRILDGNFTLNGKKYVLNKNQFPHHLHGGREGFDKKIWKSKVIYTVEGEALQLQLLSYDMEEGFPGNVALKVTFSLNDQNELKIHYYAEVDKTTPINLTNHSYFNLGHGKDKTIENHFIQIYADSFQAVDKLGMPTNALISVRGSSFDLRKPIRLKNLFSNMSESPLKLTAGFDHNFILNKDKENELTKAALLYHPESRRTIEFSTTKPGLQFYTGNGLKDVKGKSGQIYQKHAGLCLESQHFPDAPNQPEFPSPFISPDHPYDHTSIYAFGLST